jgi:nucleotide-binding universal stress UspA family protein
MKILVAYDGSRCSEASLDDLAAAGLPDFCETLVISVAEVWLPPPDGGGDVTGIKLDPDSERMIQRLYEKNRKAVAEAGALADHARERLKAMFPSWQIASEATYGSPAWEILDRADVLQPELIVVGSHGHSIISRFFLGSISQKVLTEAHCSVRVARGRIEVDPSPVRIVIGFDGSKGAQAAVEAVADRRWHENSQVRLIAVTEEVNPSDVGLFTAPSTHSISEVNGSEHEWIEKLATNSLTRLQAKNIPAAFEVHAGNPKNVLVEQSEKWNADCIFVGANAFGSRLERFLLGSTSAAVAARAHCSVEVVRKLKK